MAVRNRCNAHGRSVAIQNRFGATLTLSNDRPMTERASADRQTGACARLPSSHSTPCLQLPQSNEADAVDGCFGVALTRPFADDAKQAVAFHGLQFACHAVIHIGVLERRAGGLDVCGDADVGLQVNAC